MKFISAVEKAVGLAIKKHREESPVDVGTLASKAGISRQQWYNYEKANDRLTLIRFIVLCRVLGISAVQVLSDVLKDFTKSNKKGDE